MAKTSKPADLIGMATAKLATLTTGNAYDASKVTALARSIKTRNNTLSADIHAAAVASIYLSLPPTEGGSYNGEPARQLVNNLNVGAVRLKTLVDWFTAFSNIRLSMVKDKGEYSVKMAKPGDDDYRDTIDVAKALATPFWTVDEKTKGAQAFDLSLAIAKLVAQGTKDGVPEADKGNVIALATWARNKGLLDNENKAVRKAA